MLDRDAWDQANGDPSLIIADGPSVTVQVHGSMLVIKDGPLNNTRERAIARVPRIVKHVAILTAHGYVSLQAMRWMDDCEITWAIVDRSGQFPNTLGVSGAYVNPMYLRQQAMCAPGMPAWFTGVKIMRRLIERKIEGQAWNVETVLGLAETAKTIREMIPKVQAARSTETIRGYEGNAADTYWDAWKGLPVVWKRPVPSQPHWIRFPSRRTLRRSWETNRGATDPINAALNFGYKCAETECTLAALAASLSPAMGIGHVDRPGRDSFALDLIEPMRPRVDRIILEIMSEPLDKRWFKESREGIVTVCSPLTHRILASVHMEAMYIIQDTLAVTELLNGTRKYSRYQSKSK